MYNIEYNKTTKVFDYVQLYWLLMNVYASSLNRVVLFCLFLSDIVTELRTLLSRNSNF
jgi:hypothetical protein